jgi:hypothetical protein
MSISNSSKNAVNHLLPMDTLYLENYDIEARKLQAREVVKLAKAFIQILKLGYSYLINASQKHLKPIIKITFLMQRAAKQILQEQYFMFPKTLFGFYRYVILKIKLVFDC